MWYVYDGEIAFQDGKNNFYNGICSFVGLAENEQYIIPDIKTLQNCSSIHNNETGQIDKYESLMRIIDVNGNVVSLLVFMDLPKNIITITKSE